MRNLFYFLSALFFADCLRLIGRRSITLGLGIMLFISAAFLGLGLFWPWVAEVTQSGIGKNIKMAFLCCCAVYFMFLGYMLSAGRDNRDYTENAVIVLGCGLNTDGTPSPTLKRRLDGCIEYRRKNPGAVIVVSGGKSRNSPLTEAQGMKNYLVDMGIPEEKILTEERAGNTRENFRFSKELLESKGISTENIVFITNSFHCFRAGHYAAEEGFENAKCIGVTTDIVVYIPAVLRESCGAAAMLIFNY